MIEAHSLRTGSRGLRVACVNSDENPQPDTILEKTGTERHDFGDQINVTINGTTTTFEHPQSDNPPADIQASHEWSSNLTDWYDANCFAAAIENPDDLIVPAITLTEVHRWMLRVATESEALAAVAVMKQGKVVPLDDQLSILAAELSHRHKLPLANGIIYTTAKHQDAELITQDADLEGLPGAKYVRHPETSE